MTALAALVLGQAVLKPYTLEGFRVGLPAAPALTTIPGAPRGMRTWLAVTPGGTRVTVSLIEGPGDEPPAQVLAEVGISALSESTETVRKNLSS